MADVEIDVVVQAIDRVTAELQKIGASVDGMANQVEAADARVQTANETTTFSIKELGTSFAGLMTSATSLIFMFDRMEKAQYTLNRAQNLLEDTTRRVQRAQEAYNEAVEKYGADSPQAAAAAGTLKAAQDDLTLAGERLQIAQSNMNQAMMSTVAMVIPAVITGITSLQGVIAGFSAFLATNPMGWLIIALSAIIALVVALATNFMGFRDAVIGVFTAIYSAIKPVVDAIIGLVQGLYDIVKGIVDVVAGFISWLTGAAGTAASTAASITGGGTVGGGAGAAIPLGPGQLSRNLRYYQFGGLVEETGLAFLHRGETVIPAGGGFPYNDYSQTIVYAQVSSDYDVERLADKLDEIRKRKLLAYGRRSGW